MPSPGGGGSGLPPRLCNDPPRLGPRALTFMEPHAGTWDVGSSTWDAGSTTSSPAQAHVYEVADDDFSQIHWTPEYSVSCANFIPKIHGQSNKQPGVSILRNAAGFLLLLPIPILLLYQFSSIATYACFRL
jgi:hypothetical protein